MRRETLLLEEMIAAAERVMDLVEATPADDLDRDRDRRDALLWNYTVLGEAASQLPVEFIQEHSDVEWRRPVQLRNRIVHGYWSIDLSILRHNATTQLPEFLARLRAVLGSINE